jgi:hypothetical protein
VSRFPLLAEEMGILLMKRKGVLEELVEKLFKIGFLQCACRLYRKPGCASTDAAFGHSG